MKSEPSGTYCDWSATRDPERPWLLQYHLTVAMKIFVCEKDTSVGVRKVYLTFEEALVII